MHHMILCVYVLCACDLLCASCDLVFYVLCACALLCTSCDLFAVIKRGPLSEVKLYGSRPVGTLCPYMEVFSIVSLFGEFVKRVSTIQVLLI